MKKLTNCLVNQLRIQGFGNLKILISKAASIFMQFHSNPFQMHNLQIPNCSVLPTYISSQIYLKNPQYFPHFPPNQRQKHNRFRLPLNTHQTRMPLSQGLSTNLPKFIFTIKANKKDRRYPLPTKQVNPYFLYVEAVLCGFKEPNNAFYEQTQENQNNRTQIPICNLQPMPTVIINLTFNCLIRAKRTKQKGKSKDPDDIVVGTVWYTEIRYICNQYESESWQKNNKILASLLYPKVCRERERERGVCGSGVLQAFSHTYMWDEYVGGAGIVCMGM